jgi:hypothetical protein
MADVTAALRQLQEARQEAEQELRKLDQAISALSATNGSGRRGRPPNRTQSTQTPKPAGGARSMSASARRRIAMAQKARWAKWRAAQKKS